MKLSNTSLSEYNFYLDQHSLPNGWQISSLDNLSFVVTDGTHKTPNYQASGIRFISIKNVKPFKPINWQSYEKYISIQEHQELIKRCHPELDDIVFPRIGTLGYAKRIDFSEPVSLFVGLGLIKPVKKYVAPKYLELYMNTPYISKLSEEKANGTGRMTLPLEESRKFPVPVPPLNEQHRIVARIEELFSELDKGVESLKIAQAQLKVYRQSILQHAFEGKLTAQWRAGNTDKLESADALLRRIQQERLQCYEQQLANWEATKKQGSKPKKPKSLTPPTATELTGLKELPEGWLYVKVGTLITDPTYGTAKKCDYGIVGTGVLRIPNVASGKIDASDLKFGEFSNDEITTYKLETDDILIIRSNGSISIVGKCALVSNADTNHLYAGYLIRLRPYKKIVMPNYLLNAFSAHSVRKQIEEKAKSTSGVNNINTGEIQSLIIAICGIEEQKQIQIEIESRLSDIDHLEKTIATSLHQAEALRQSILEKAFYGQLVQQDASDEPATALLIRIQAEKAAQLIGKKAARK